MIRNEGICGFAPEGTAGRGITVGAWSQHPGKRSMVSGGWKRFKTKRLSINFYESQGLVSKEQDLRKKRKRPSVRWWAVTNLDERLWSRKPSSLFPASASCLLAS